MKKCPFCAEDIQDTAIVCKHCKSNFKISDDAELIQSKIRKMEETALNNLNIEILDINKLSIPSEINFYNFIASLAAGAMVLSTNIVLQYRQNMPQFQIALLLLFWISLIICLYTALARNWQYNIYLDSAGKEKGHDASILEYSRGLENGILSENQRNEIDTLISKNRTDMLICGERKLKCLNSATSHEKIALTTGLLGIVFLTGFSFNVLLSPAKISSEVELKPTQKISSKVTLTPTNENVRTKPDVIQNSQTANFTAAKPFNGPTSKK